MLRKAMVSCLCTLTILSISGLAHATEVRWYRNLDAVAPGDSAEEIARSYIEQRAGRMRLARVQLAPEARIIPWRDHRVVRIDQEFEGVPVFNREVIVRIDPDGRVQTVATNALADVDVGTRPVVSAAEALAKAAAIWGVNDLDYGRATLGIQMHVKHGRLIWRVDGNLGLYATRTWVDAVSGDVLHRFWRVYTAEAQVYEQNPVSTPTLSTVTLQDLPTDATTLTGTWVTAYRYVSGAFNQQNAQLSDLELEQTAIADSNGDFFFTPTTDASQPEFHDPYAEVSVFYHVNKIYRYFRTVHNYSTPRIYTALANYGEDEETVYANAFFSAVGTDDYVMAMGQANGVDLGYDGDVTYHEFGHSVVDNIARLTYQYDMMDQWGMNTGPGGLHEGLADYWAATLTDDAMMGEYSLEGLQVGAGRDMSELKTCPEDVWGEVHDDGEVAGSALWASRVAVNDADLHDQIVYGSLSMQTSRATFQDFAIGMQDAAQALVGTGDMTQAQYDAMDASLEDHGMLDCGRALPMGDEEVKTNSMFNFAFVAAMLSQMGGSNVTCEEARTMNMPYVGRPFPAVPGNFQFRKEVPATATSLTLRVRHEPGTDLQFWIHARKAEMVHFNEQNIFGMFTFVDVADFDHAWGPFENADQQVVIDMTSDPALEPGATYYFAITAKNCTMAGGQPARQNILVTATTDDEPYTPDAGVQADASIDATPDAGTGDDGGNKGCGCAQRGSGTSLPWGLVLLGLVTLGWIRRRR